MDIKNICMNTPISECFSKNNSKGNKNVTIKSGSIIGKSHQLRKENCQDATYSLSKNGVDVVAVADGAGGYEYSEIAAKVASKEICKLVAENFDFFYDRENDNDIKLVINKHIIDCIKEVLTGEYIKEYGFVSKYIENDAKIDISKHMGTTLLYAAMKGNKFITGHIGDGYILIANNENECEEYSLPENGYDSNYVYLNQTYSIIHSPEKLRFTSGNLQPEEKGFILATDGANIVMKNKNDVNQIFEETLNGDILDVLENVKVKEEDVNRDDISIAVISR